MKWILFFFLAACSVQVFAKTDAEKEKETIEDCTKRADTILKMGKAYTGPSGSITARCKTAVNSLSQYGYYYFDKCISENADKALGADAAKKINILDECIKTARGNIRDANTQAQQGRPVVEPMSWDECKDKLKKSGFNIDAVARYTRDLSKINPMTERLAKCGDYLDCIQQVVAKANSRISVADECVELEPGQQNGPTSRVNRQSSGVYRPPAQ